MIEHDIQREPFKRAGEFTGAGNDCGVLVESAADGHLTLVDYRSPREEATESGGRQVRIGDAHGQCDQPRLAELAAFFQSKNGSSLMAVGTRMPDGTVYAGMSPDTGRRMYTMPKDAPVKYDFNEAGNYAAKLDAHGHKDWRVPTMAELNVLFGDRAAIGSFETSGPSPGWWYRSVTGWYWSSTPDSKLFAWAQSFRDGTQYDGSKTDRSGLRCVRG